KGVCGHLPIRREIVGAIDVHRIDRIILIELNEIDDSGGSGPHLIDVFLGHDHVAALLELVALDDVAQRHFFVAAGTPSLLLDARLTDVMELIEGDRGARLSGRVDLDGDVDQADAQVPFPGCTCCHSFSPGFLSARPALNSTAALPSALSDYQSDI